MRFFLSPEKTELLKGEEEDVEINAAAVHYKVRYT